MHNGADNSDCIVIANCADGKRYLKLGGYKGNSTSMYQLGFRMKGNRKPVLMDNAAIIDALSIAISAIEMQEGLVSRAKQIARQAARDIGEL